jgi:HK97 family phage major capsid protein
MATPEEIKAALDRISEKVSERTDELGARLQAVEQIVVSTERNQGGSYLAHAGIGHDATQELNDSAQFGQLREWNQLTARANLSTSIRAIVNQPGSDGLSSSGGYMPSQPEQAGIYGPLPKPLSLLSALPTRPTTRDSVEFIQLGVTGDAAEQENEGDTKAELDFEGTPKTVNIITVAGWTTASRQVLSDHPALQQSIDATIRNKVLARLEDQLINGVGGQGKIEGLLSQCTVFMPTIAHTVIDAIGEGIVKMRAQGYAPNLVLMNPVDHFEQQIDRTSDESYLLGSPVAPVLLVVWNTPVVLSAAVPAGECLILDTAFVTVLDREKPSVVLSNSHADYFTRNLVAILGALRAGLEVRDTGAVYRLTYTDIDVVTSS